MGLSVQTKRVTRQGCNLDPPVPARLPTARYAVVAQIKKSTLASGHVYPVPDDRVRARTSVYAQFMTRIEEGHWMLIRMTTMKNLSCGLCTLSKTSISLARSRRDVTQCDPKLASPFTVNQASSISVHVLSDEKLFISASAPVTRFQGVGSCFCTPSVQRELPGS